MKKLVKTSVEESSESSVHIGSLKKLVLILMKELAVTITVLMNFPKIVKAK